jgi:hypothetical protein
LMYIGVTGGQRDVDFGFDLEFKIWFQIYKQHDSGGPAVRDGVLLGIVSFGGKQCGDPRSPGVYSRVSEITDWVETTITSNEAQKVPELQAKIKKARQREKELQK